MNENIAKLRSIILLLEQLERELCRTFGDDSLPFVERQERIGVLQQNMWDGMKGLRHEAEALVEQAAVGK